MRFLGHVSDVPKSEYLEILIFLLILLLWLLRYVFVTGQQIQLIDFSALFRIHSVCPKKCALSVDMGSEGCIAVSLPGS